MSFASRSLQWIDMQGYRLSEAEKRRLTVPLKFAPALCTIFGALSLYQQSVPGLAVLAALAFAGALLPRHPFDYLYGFTLASLLRTGWAPTNPPQRRFACFMGAGMLATSAVAFAFGYPAVALVVGLSFVGAAALQALTNWCLPSFIYNLAVAQVFPPSAPRVEDHA